MRHIVSTLTRSSCRANKSCYSTTGPRIFRMAATESGKATGDAPTAAPWYAAYPAPKSEVVTISREEVLALLKSTPVEKRDFALVDLRRNDFEVSFRGLLCCCALAARP